MLHLRTDKTTIKNRAFKGGKIDIDGSKGSQFITGLLLPPFADEDLHRVSNLVSRLRNDSEVMDNWGISYSHEQLKILILSRSTNCIEGRETIVDGDWSLQLHFTLEALCGSPELEVTGIQYVHSRRFCP